MSEALMVGMAEIKVTRTAGNLLIALGLGSCIGICAFDPKLRVAGMAHVVLPDSAGHEGAPGKFADTAVPLLLTEMEKLGAGGSRLRIAIAGGAQLFAFAGSGPRLEIGARNAEAVLTELKRRGYTPLATDIGGSAGRTVTLTLDGLVRVKTIGKGERDLVSLGDAGLPAERPLARAVETVARIPTPGLDALRGKR